MAKHVKFRGIPIRFDSDLRQDEVHLGLPNGGRIVFRGPSTTEGITMTNIEDMQDNPVLEFTSPESSTIASANYDPDTLTLFVHFTNGKTYRGNDFPQKAWDEFVQARSKGAHFNQRIRPLYLMKKMD